MTLKDIKRMFHPGHVWHAYRTGAGKHRDEKRTVHKAGSRDLVWKLADGSLYYTSWPKASEVQEARPGYLRFGYADTPGVVVTLAVV